jgi:hypothetical protein
MYLFRNAIKKGDGDEVYGLDSFYSSRQLKDGIANIDV